MLINNSLQNNSELKAWLHEVIGKNNINAADVIETMHPLPGDAGFRQYFTFVGEKAKGLIAVYSPPSTEKNLQFLEIAAFFDRHGIRVPKVIASDLERGFFLLEKLGEELYLDHLSSPEKANSLYERAINELIIIQSCPVEKTIFPEYSPSLLLAEMELFTEWFVSKLLKKKVREFDQEMLVNTFQRLLDNAQEQPQCIVHRDYHSRNIVYGREGEPGVIDFQDAVVGPLTYDVASLLRDCYVEWSDEQVEKWLLHYQSVATERGIIENLSPIVLLRWFDLMGLQRHIKVMGIFSRLYMRDKKTRYLNDLPLVIRYTRKVARKYPEFYEFADWFERELKSSILEQPWIKREEYTL